MILVTGATGFIGSHLVEELVKAGRVSCLVSKKNKIYGNTLDSQEESLRRLGCKIVYGDLLDKESLEKGLRGVSKIYHLAAIGHPMNIPISLYYETNVSGVKNLLEAAKKNKVKKIVHVSTMSVFGFSRDGNPLDEKSPMLPVSDYGESKKQGEILVRDFCERNKIKCVVVRPPMVFGPRDFQFLKLFKLINTGVFPLLKKGKGTFEFCYVKNFVEGILLADKKGKNMEAYNISDGQTYTIRQVFEEIARVEKKKLFPFSLPIWPVRVAGLMCEKLFGAIGKQAPFNSGTALWMSGVNEMDITKAKNELGYKTIVPLSQSVKDTFKGYVEAGYL